MLGIYLAIPINTIFNLVFFAVVIYCPLSVISAIYSFKYLRRHVDAKLLKYQNGQRSDSRHRDVVSEDETSLQEVVLSPRPSWHGSFSQSDEAIAVTTVLQSSSPNLASTQDPSENPSHAR